MIPIPLKLQRRPTWRGMPIPVITTIKPDGEPDFRVTDHYARLNVIRTRCCQLCGEPLGRNIFFAGGPAAAQANVYFEPAMHLECMIYAMQVCPFICGTMQHADIEKVQAENPTMKIMVDQSYTSAKSDVWVLIKCRSFISVQQSDQTILVRPQQIDFTTEALPATKMRVFEWDRVYAQLLNA